MSLGNTMYNETEFCAEVTSECIFGTKCGTFMGQKQDIFVMKMSHFCPENVPLFGTKSGHFWDIYGTKTGHFLSWKCHENVPKMSHFCPENDQLFGTKSRHFWDIFVLKMSWIFNKLTIFNWKKAKIQEKTSKKAITADGGEGQKGHFGVWNDFCTEFGLIVHSFGAHIAIFCPRNLKFLLLPQFWSTKQKETLIFRKKIMSETRKNVFYLTQIKG